ncbi:LamG domain-containing protein [Acinetobacter sp. YH01024]|uniref:LamG domain-containing protein n=1 Tax=Acinetobacter sp. YH01024 TaxID=2601037 RepID=UPI0015D1563B|nr:LamG domain-containing protein [Acinetobacter sp. YH01024]
MSVEVEFNYVIDGLFHSVNYYRSEAPMNLSAMPPAVATNITGFSYVDNTVENEKLYYVRFGAVSAGIEKISSEIQVSTSTWVEYAVTYLELKNDVIDRGLLPQIHTPSNVNFLEDAAVFNGVSSAISSAANSNFGFGTGDFCIEFAYKIPSSVTTGRVFVDLAKPTSLFGTLFIYPTAVYFRLGDTWINTNTPVNNNNSWHHLAMSRSGANLRLFIDGTLVKTWPIGSTNFGSNQPLFIGKNWENNVYASGSIRKVRITKGKPVYNSNFQITYQV